MYGDCGDWLMKLCCAVINEISLMPHPYVVDEATNRFTIQKQNIDLAFYQNTIQNI